MDTSCGLTPRELHSLCVGFLPFLKPLSLTEKYPSAALMCSSRLAPGVDLLDRQRTGGDLDISFCYSWCITTEMLPNNTGEGGCFGTPVINPRLLFFIEIPKLAKPASVHGELCFFLERIARAAARPPDYLHWSVDRHQAFSRSVSAFSHGPSPSFYMTTSSP